ncbi:hypothetical protein ASE75_02980 [Sphingomonas sp. Leaf17]|nr:hypothetical protein ASE75_02980 [Sphingomonas sp. Leaf17]
MTETSQERTSHAFCIRKPHKQRDGPYRFIPIAKADACSFAAQTLDRTCRRFARFLPKQTSELANAQTGGLGEPFDRQWL